MSEFTLARLLANPNFQTLLAGIGTGLDPEGVGGAIGRPTIGAIQSQAAQKAIGEQENLRRGTNLLAIASMVPEDERGPYIQQALAMLGGLGPLDKPGPNSVKMEKDGTATINVTIPRMPNPMDIQQEQGPRELPAGVTAPKATTPRQQQSRGLLSRLIPFY